MEPINGFEDYMIDRDGNIMGARLKRLMKPQNNGDGYLNIALWKDKKPKKYLIHRLLALQFIPNPDNLPLIDHIDRDRQNNNLENLRWVTRSQNMRNKDCKGYHWYKRMKKWKAEYCLNGKIHHIGYYKTEQEAREAYLNATKHLF
jgi:hypothetical protein